MRATRLWAYRVLRLSPLVATLIASLWILQTNPFAQPLAERSATELRQKLDRMLMRQMDQEGLDQRLEAALAAGDLDRAALLIEAGQDLAPPATPRADLAARYDRQRGEAQDTRLRDCALCMVEAGACKTLSQIGLCLVPFELTPAGDLNALRQEGWNWASRQEVDEVNVGLALVGLGATATIFVTGGGSATAKAGATALRVARRIGSLTPRFGAELADLGRIGLKPAAFARYLGGRAPLEQALDTARLARLQQLGTDLTRVADNTSVAETLVLLRHVETAGDVRRLARVSDAAGPETRKFMEILGPRRVFGTLVRLSDLALTAALLFYAAGLQLLVAAANWIGRRALRAAALALRPA